VVRAVIAETLRDVAISTALTAGIVVVLVVARFAAWGRDVSR
jgi:hypothetical protein